MPTARSSLGYDVFVARKSRSPHRHPQWAMRGLGSHDVDVDLRRPRCRAGRPADDRSRGRRAGRLGGAARPPLTTIYITHGHGDHYLGLPMFSTTSRRREWWPRPERRGTCNTTANAGQHAQGTVPRSVAETTPLPEPLDSPQIQLEDSVSRSLRPGIPTPWTPPRCRCLTWA